MKDLQQRLEAKRDEILRTGMHSLYARGLCAGQDILIPLVALLAEALESYSWQNAEYDNDIMSDGSIAKEALQALEEYLK